MYTRCPHCQALFRVSHSELSAAEGQVRCGRCQQVFNALEALTDQLPAAMAVPESEPHGDEVPSMRADTTVAAPAVDTSEAPTTGVAAGTAVAPVAQDLQTEAEALPIQLREAPSGGRSALATAVWAAAMVLFALLLVGQVAYFWHDDLVRRHEQLRPWLEQFCAYAGCELAMKKNTQLIEALKSDVRSHPTEDNALLATISFVNNAEFRQPFPTLHLRLYDHEQHVVAHRTFQPPEYLSTDINTGNGIAPRQRIDVELELADPGTEAAGFSFDFL